jgi:glycosyltransferase involved in cell wall biosynthesis
MTNSQEIFKTGRDFRELARYVTIKAVQGPIRGAWRRWNWLKGRRDVLFIGYAQGDLGLGQTFRNNVVAAVNAGVRVSVYPFQKGVETRQIAPFRPELYDTTHTYRVNFIEVAPDQVPVVRRCVPNRMTLASYNILRTFWELPAAPVEWRPMLDWVQEIWAPNAFVADALKSVFPRKITIIPTVVDTGGVSFKDRKAFGMEAGRFYFLFSFDYFSSPYRKNPLGTLRAFQEAFPARTENVGLIIKSTGTIEKHSQYHNAILEAASSDARIIVIDQSIDRNDMLSLIRASDVYVSLHRSEGFGAGMAEAMSLGRIVIGTDFSGNTEFLTHQTGFPVPCRLRPVEPHEYNWSAGQVWAEADIPAAAAIMRYVAAHPGLCAQRALAGQALVKSRYSAEAVGIAIKRRIDEIANNRPAGF